MYHENVMKISLHFCVFVIFSIYIKCLILIFSSLFCFKCCHFFRIYLIMLIFNVKSDKTEPSILTHEIIEFIFDLILNFDRHVFEDIFVKYHQPK